MNKINTHTATEINQLHLAIESRLRKSLTDAMRIGQLLEETKDNLPHGSFTDWIESNLSFTPRTARNYQKLYRNQDTLTEADSISEAYTLLNSKTETVSDLDRILKHLKGFGYTNLIPKKGYQIELYNFAPLGEEFADNHKAMFVNEKQLKKYPHETSMEVMYISWNTDNPEYLNPEVVRLGADGYGYAIHNKRGGFKFDSTEQLIQCYKDTFNFLKTEHIYSTALDNLITTN